MDETDKQLLERTESSREVFKGALLHVFADKALLPDGSVSIREWIKHPGASAVLPVFSNGDVMLIQQFRYPLKKVFFEVPAGKIDEGESPGSTVRRELKEEAGLTCTHFKNLGAFHPSIGYTDEIIHLYVAWDITVYDQSVDDDEFLIRKRLPFNEVIKMVHNGEITDGKSMVTILRAHHWWKNNPPFDI